jgi:hypothetical protein
LTARISSSTCLRARLDMLGLGLGLDLSLGGQLVGGPLLLGQLLGTCGRVGPGREPAQDDGEPAKREGQGDEPDHQERVCAAHG